MHYLFLVYPCSIVNVHLWTFCIPQYSQSYMLIHLLTSWNSKVINNNYIQYMLKSYGWAPEKYPNTEVTWSYYSLYTTQSCLLRIVALVFCPFLFMPYLYMLHHPIGQSDNDVVKWGIWVQKVRKHASWTNSITLTIHKEKKTKEKGDGDGINSTMK